MYIQLDGRRTIDLLDPDYGEIPLETMAYALSYINRFTGHARQYSVAQHCVHVAQCCEPRDRLAALLHDLHEAVIGDISTPVKTVLGMQTVNLLEATHFTRIWERWGDGQPFNWAAIKRADGAMCNAEADQILGGRVGDGWPDVPPADIKEIPFWEPMHAFDRFMESYNDYRH